MIQQFAELSLILLHAVTINLALVHLDDNLELILKVYRRRLSKALRRLSRGSIVRGKFDMVLKFADGLEFELPEGDLPEELRGKVMAHQRYGMLHIHFVCFDPELSKSEIRDILVEAFPGNKRVCIKRPHEDVVHPDGTVTRGIQGYLEYLSMEKIDLDFGVESVDAILDFAKLDNTWTRANRNFSFGKRDMNTSDLIDPSRVELLERQACLERTRKNFKDLSFAERWLHQWMSDARRIFDRVTLAKAGQHWLKRLRELFLYGSNSSRNKTTEAPENTGVPWVNWVRTVGRWLRRARIPST